MYLFVGIWREVRTTSATWFECSRESCHVKLVWQSLANNWICAKPVPPKQLNRNSLRHKLPIIQLDNSFSWSYLGFFYHQQFADHPGLPYRVAVLSQLLVGYIWWSQSQKTSNWEFQISSFQMPCPNVPSPIISRFHQSFLEGVPCFLTKGNLKYATSTSQEPTWGAIRAIISDELTQETLVVTSLFSPMGDDDTSHLYWVQKWMIFESSSPPNDMMHSPTIFTRCQTDLA